MNGRRGFMKCLVGALVASAIEIRLTTAPIIESVEHKPKSTAHFDPVAYMGNFQWVDSRSVPSI